MTDIARSAEWYCEVLGFSVADEFEGAGFRRARLRHPQASIILTLTAHDRGSGQAFSEMITGLDHLAFSVGTVDDVQAFKRRFEQLGVDHSEVKPARGGAGALITLRDPDNIQLEVFTPGE